MYNETPFWDLALPTDLTLPPALPDINSNDFLALLEKQIGANPQAVPRTQFPISNPTPPLSEDSSPSPPGSLHDTPGTTFAGARTASGRQHDDDQLKRKASFDEDDDDESGQPQHKTAHTEKAPTTKKGAARRKSGGSAQDESRLQKRKEQNRAAQRAFRERKEKHVKDLEDKVAELQAKNDEQATENEHLRDLLGRLQTENQNLKQSQFTFSFPPASGNSSSSDSPPEQTLNMYNAASSSSSQSPATVSSRESPQSTFDSPTLLDSFAPLPDSTFAASPGSTQIFGAPMNNTPYTTIASNPLFTSYREPTPNAWASFGGFSDSFDMTGSQDLTMSSWEDLFGGFEGHVPFQQFVPTTENGLSPVAHPNQKTPPSDTACTGGEGACPKSKKDISEIIGKTPLSTFGPPVLPGDTKMNDATGKGCCKDVPDGECVDKINLAALPKTEKKDTHVDLDQAWKHVKKQPKFDECDIDELCSELTRKAKCDGSKPVVERQGLSELVESIPARALQRK